ncbi:MAG: hypothetical protein H6751_11395 [Candidatus Omnitrophica bacterium]|nr:hypothetical protein [Candidatus Omnitrophota bacterium]
MRSISICFIVLVLLLSSIAATAAVEEFDSAPQGWDAVQEHRGQSGFRFSKHQ